MRMDWRMGMPQGGTLSQISNGSVLGPIGGVGNLRPGGNGLPSQGGGYGISTEGMGNRRPGGSGFGPGVRWGGDRGFPGYTDPSGIWQNYPAEPNSLGGQRQQPDLATLMQQLMGSGQRGMPGLGRGPMPSQSMYPGGSNTFNENPGGVNYDTGGQWGNPPGQAGGYNFGAGGLRRGPRGGSMY